MSGAKWPVPDEDMTDSLGEFLFRIYDNHDAFPNDYARWGAWLCFLHWGFHNRLSYPQKERPGAWLVMKNA